jgi:flagellar protein FliO/FliZ
MPNAQGSLENTPYNPSDVAAAATSTSYSWWGLIGTILIFILILAVALWVIRRMNGTSVRGMNAPWARVLDRQLLSGQQSLYLVEIAGKLQVLGGTDHHLVKIDEINDPDLAAEILDEITHRPAERMEGFFSGVAKQVFGGKRRKAKDSFSTELERLMKEVDS